MLARIHTYSIPMLETPVGFSIVLTSDIVLGWAEYMDLLTRSIMKIFELALTFGLVCKCQTKPTLKDIQLAMLPCYVAMSPCCYGNPKALPVG